MVQAKCYQNLNGILAKIQSSTELFELHYEILFQFQVLDHDDPHIGSINLFTQQWTSF